MASDLSFVEFVADQCHEDCGVSYRRMFGEFGLYSQGTFIGVICDNRLYVKPTEEGRAFIGEVVEAPAYPGAKPSFLIGEGIEDGDWLSDLVRITARALRASNPRPRGKGSRGRSRT